MSYRSSGASKATLFLGDLSSVCTEEDIEKLFCQYGKIRHIRIQRSPGSYSSLGYGFIRMGNNAESLRAKEELDGVLLCGRRIRVREAAFGVGGDSGAAKAPPKNSLFVRFMGLDRHALTNEEKIREIYSKLGPISDVSIRESKFDKKTGIQKGYGFVHFDESGEQGSEGVEAALTAVTAVPKVVVDQVFYACEVSRNLQAQLTGEVAAAGNSRGRNNNNSNSNSGSFFPGGGAGGAGGAGGLMSGMAAEYPDGYSVNSRNVERSRGGQAQAPHQVLGRQHQMDGGAMAEHGHIIHASGSSSYESQDPGEVLASGSVGSGHTSHSSSSSDMSSAINSQNQSFRSGGSGGSSHHILASGSSAYTRQLQQLQQMQQQQYGMPVTFPQRPAPAAHPDADAGSAGEYHGKGSTFSNNRDGNRYNNGPQEAQSVGPLNAGPAALLSFLQANGKLPSQKDNTAGKGSNYNRSGRNDEGNAGGNSGGGGSGWFSSQRQAAAAANSAPGSNQRHPQNPYSSSDYQHQLQQQQQQTYPNPSVPSQIQQQRQYSGGYQPAFFAEQQRQQQRAPPQPHVHVDDYGRSGERVSEFDRQQQEAFLQQQMRMQNQYLISHQDDHVGAVPPMNADHRYAQQNSFHQPPPPPQQQHSALRYDNDRNGTEFNVNAGNYYPQALVMQGENNRGNSGSGIGHASERGWPGTDPISTGEGRSILGNSNATASSSVLPSGAIVSEGSNTDSIVYPSNEAAGPTGQQQHLYMNQGFVVQDGANADGRNRSGSAGCSHSSSTEDAAVIASGDTQITQMLDNMAAMVLQQRNVGDGTDSGVSNVGEAAYSSEQNLTSSLHKEGAENDHSAP